MSDISPITEADHEHATPIITDDIGVTRHPGSDSLRSPSDRRPRSTPPSTAGAIRGVRDRDTSTTPAPEITVIGELSASAIEALAALLIDSYWREQEIAATDATVEVSP